jgi:hypothetical protein
MVRGYEHKLGGTRMYTYHHVIIYLSVIHLRPSSARLRACLTLGADIDATNRILGAWPTAAGGRMAYGTWTAVFSANEQPSASRVGDGGAFCLLDLQLRSPVFR